VRRGPPVFFFFFKDFIYSFDRDRHSERGNTSRVSGRGRSRLPAERGAWCGARSQDSEIMTWAEGRCLTTEPPRHPEGASSLNNHTNFSSRWALAIPFLPPKPVSRACLSTFVPDGSMRESTSGPAHWPFDHKTHFLWNGNLNFVFTFNPTY